MKKQEKRLKKEVDRLQPTNSIPIPGILGDFTGRVSVPNRLNYVYVRISGRSLMEVFNDSVPLEYDLPVLIGKDSRLSNQMRVISVRTDSMAASGNPTLSVVHHKTHEWQVTGGSQDVVYCNVRQLLPLRPQPLITGQAVYVASNVSYLGGEWMGVTGSLIDLSPASPPTGSRFILLSVDSDGLLMVTTGSVQSLGILTYADIPQPVIGTIPVAAVRLYPGQIRINDVPAMRDLLDLRWNSLDTRATVTGSPASISNHSDLTHLDYATAGHTGFEPSLGNPASTGQVLASTDGGVRSWVDLGAGLTDGWVSAVGTWTFSSADAPTYVVSVNADMTTVIGVGQRIKLTHATVKYFIVTAVGAYSGGNTLITLYGGTDYTLAAAGDAITNPYYSIVKAPFGFPLNPTKWTVEVQDVTSRAQATPDQNVWYNLGSVAISLPIGVWGVSYQVCIQTNDATATDWYVGTTLSTANNSASDADFSTFVRSADAKRIGQSIFKEKVLSVDSKTSYYLNSACFVASLDNIYNKNDSSPLIIRATCVYL